jgi:CHAT domain-containing protein
MLTMFGASVPIERPDNAKAGRQRLLDGSVFDGFLYVFGHGKNVRWPRTMSSSIQLSKKVTLTARDWLTAGLSAAMVFLNCCELGGSDTMVGESRGFALATSVRGTGTVIAALSPIGIASAKTFATGVFVAMLDGQSSLGAVQSASRNLIEARSHPKHWAAYVHVGVATTFAASTGKRNGRLPR